MFNRHCHRVNLTINHDWESTKARAIKLLALEENVEPWQHGTVDFFSIGSIGTISKHKLSKQWYRLSGPSIDNTMPWLADMLETMAELKPDNGDISLVIGNAGEHIDWPQAATALNFIISNTDSDAFTWVKGNDFYETYPSEVNTAWLLNTQYPHGIKNTGERWGLCIHFNADYETVKEWFDNHPNLIFGDKGEK